MVAIVFDPFVCKSSIWWMFPECWGIAVMSALPMAFACACAVRGFAVRRLR